MSYPRESSYQPVYPYMAMIQDVVARTVQDAFARLTPITTNQAHLGYGHIQNGHTQQHVPRLDQPPYPFPPMMDQGVYNGASYSQDGRATQSRPFDREAGVAAVSRVDTAAGPDKPDEGPAGDQIFDDAQLASSKDDQAKDAINGKAMDDNAQRSTKIMIDQSKDVEQPSKDNDTTNDQVGQQEARVGRIRMVTNSWNDNTSKWEEKEEAKTAYVNTKDASSGEFPARFITQKEQKDPKKIQTETIEIHSLELKELIAEVDEDFRQWVDEDDPVPLEEEQPFTMFICRWEDFMKACEPRHGDSVGRGKAREDLTHLMQCIQQSQISQVTSFLKYRDSGLKAKRIKWTHLWGLFPHGELIYARSVYNELQMLKVDRWSYEHSTTGFTVTCLAFDFDGSKFSPYEYKFNIPSFKEEKAINSLQIFPIQYYRPEDGRKDAEHRQRLVDRGRKYWEICTGAMNTFQFDYTGKMFVFRPHINKFGQLTADNHSMDVKGRQNRVIVDNYAFMNSARSSYYHDSPPLSDQIPANVEPLCMCDGCRSTFEAWTSQPTDKSSLSSLNATFADDDERLLLLPPRLLGFYIKDNMWGQFLVDGLAPIQGPPHPENGHPFNDELQLDREQKDLLLALVEQHSSSQRNNNSSRSMQPSKFDIIEGKGRGLVILLHGPPGVGKTLTAELIAGRTNRPLVSVSVAEIGVDPAKAEQNLRNVFDDSSRWNAVLLMDEADVFIERRQGGELERNALVSVLLRCLEYHDGIIILTTNKVRSIDAAMQSRIQLAIQFLDLKEDERTAIYMQRLSAIPDDEIEDRQKLREELARSYFFRHKVNGRQIRNIVNGARAWAKSNGRKVAVEDLRLIYEATERFNNCLEEEIAKQRHDHEAKRG